MIFPYPRRKKLIVLLFISILDVESSLSEITIKLSYILRTLVEFRVSEVLWIYETEKERKEWRLIKEISDYALTPPYLKKYIPKRNSLSKVGLLQPLNIPSHQVSSEFIEGEIRMGKKGDFGLRCLYDYLDSDYVVVSDSLAKKVKPYPFYPYYKGFTSRLISYQQMLEKVTHSDNVIIASRSGANLSQVEDKIREVYEENGLYLVIGPPKHGVLRDLHDFKGFIVNFIPKQGVKDVRAEEALHASLALLNFILN
ncbi:putative RNA uridine N3 methyltransferase [Stygiolobus azoricus]|uniref:putative RNA uridine N3 methyltransferase n=1 Tax=Stygiolobus azoricus TaxID=41675 RepID=UPI001E48409B|nr:putative RNA uridine N3 methyltransferase [Stygiolobus azoricus]